MVVTVVIVLNCSLTAFKKILSLLTLCLLYGVIYILFPHMIAHPQSVVVIQAFDFNR